MGAAALTPKEPGSTDQSPRQPLDLATLTPHPSPLTPQTDGHPREIFFDPWKGAPEGLRTGQRRGSASHLAAPSTGSMRY